VLLGREISAFAYDPFANGWAQEVIRHHLYK
jgi:hypothetical protein